MRGYLDAVAETAVLANAGISILYIGHLDGTALDRANALRRLGHRVEHISVRRLLFHSPWLARWGDRVTWRLGGHVLSPWVVRVLARALKGKHYDLCYVDGGDLVTPGVIEMLRRHAPKVINYCIDDPLGMRDAQRSMAYRKSISYYDLCVVVRQQNVDEAKRLGARNVMRVNMSSDEVSHAPRRLTNAQVHDWHSEVLFLGTWFPERGPFLAELVKRGVPLTIRGSKWQKAPEWLVLKDCFKGGQLLGDEYAFAIQSARVNLGLLSKGNRDLHTTRSLEIPALGALLCAERTSEHLAMYQEGTEALFWSTAQECASVCLDILQDEPRRARIAAAGHSRCMANFDHNESVTKSIIERALQL